MPTSPNPSFFPPFIYGLHDIGGQDRMLSAQRPGWVLDTVDLRSQTGTDYSSLARAGLGILVRLNHGYAPAGTIPPPPTMPNSPRAAPRTLATPPARTSGSSATR